MWHARDTKILSRQGCSEKGQAAWTGFPQIKRPFPEGPMYPIAGYLGVGKCSTGFWEEFWVLVPLDI